MHNIRHSHFENTVILTMFLGGSGIWTRIASFRCLWGAWFSLRRIRLWRWVRLLIIGSSLSITSFRCLWRAWFSLRRIRLWRWVWLLIIGSSLFITSFRCLWRAWFSLRRRRLWRWVRLLIIGSSLIILISDWNYYTFSEILENHR